MASEEEKQLEAYLQNEATQFQREQEVERVLACFKMDPFGILQLSYQFVEKDVKMAYRRKSLLIHPDKTKHPRSQEAFDLLKRAETELNDEKKRTWLLRLVAEAQHLIRQASTDTQLDEESTSFKDEVREKFKGLLIEEELRRRRLLKKEMERESNEARKVDEEIEKRRRKRQADKDWEDTRDKRVGNWRDFMAGKKKKRKELRPPKVLSEDTSKPYIKRPSAS
ncbi:hypothetical protein BDF22DRAFT_688856 [Syncephalis plumigaleata]|nr:hypothetical protein BDF22DRAFT_688856 [Syncephalis plumigaleata]